jgi:acetylornithine deacetylase
MTIAIGDATALLRELVRTDSRNPALASDAPAEGPIARLLADVLTRWGFDTRISDAAPERPNVVATLRGTGGGKSLMFNGHIDVVGVENMTHAPFEAFVRDGRMYGRGACDMKGGVAAMCAAAARVKGALKGDLIIACVADEEWRSLGTAALIAGGARADAAVVTEPTGLTIMPAHKGFVWIELTFHGRAAHGSRWDLGVDAIRHAGLLLSELDRIDSEVLSRKQHVLLGRPSLHAGEIQGGLGLSTYPDRCVLRIERRTIPGETTADVEREIDEVCRLLRARHPAFSADVDIMFAQPPSDVDPKYPVCRGLERAAQAHGISPRIAGMSAWTDAALLNQAGIPAVCFGPGDMGLAHAAEEYIEVREVEQAAEILASFARDWCN